MSKNTIALSASDKALVNATAIATENQKELVKLTKEIEKMELKKKLILDAIKQAMEENGLTAIETDVLDIVYVAAKTAKMFDAKRFEFEHPKMFAEYQREKAPSTPYLRITVK